MIPDFSQTKNECGFYSYLNARESELYDRYKDQDTPEAKLIIELLMELRYQRVGSYSRSER